MIKDLHCFYPGDLQPFTRKPLFVIADSDNSVVFQNVPNYFGQTLVILMSPQYVPGPFQGEKPNVLVDYAVVKCLFTNYRIIDFQLFFSSFRYFVFASYAYSSISFVLFSSCVNCIPVGEGGG